MHSNRYLSPHFLFCIFFFMHLLRPLENDIYRQTWHFVMFHSFGLVIWKFAFFPACWFKKPAFVVLQQVITIHWKNVLGNMHGLYNMVLFLFKLIRVGCWYSLSSPKKFLERWSEWITKFERSHAPKFGIVNYKVKFLFANLFVFLFLGAPSLRGRGSQSPVVWSAQIFHPYKWDGRYLLMYWGLWLPFQITWWFTIRPVSFGKSCRVFWYSLSCP